MSDDDRQRGILSPADRAYLRGDRSYGSRQSERNARARIRDRVHAAVLDFELLVERFGETDRKLVFEKRFGERAGTEGVDALVSALAFCYLGVGDTDLDFETVLREGINVAEARRDRAATVQLDLTFQTLGPDQILAKLDRGETLSLTELAYLHRSDAVRPDELARRFDDDPAEVDDGRIQSRVTDF